MKKILTILGVGLLLLQINITKLNAATVEEEYPDIKKACDNGNMEKCATLASVSYVDGYKHKKNLQKTFKYGSISCNNDIGKGCFFLGLSYLDKHDGILAVDEFKAHEYFKKSCDLGSASGCFAFADDYKEGQGCRQNYKTAVKYFEKAIKLGDTSSYVNLGILYYNGSGVNRNVVKAKKLFGKACDAKLQMGCDLYKKVSKK